MYFFSFIEHVNILKSNMSSSEITEKNYESLIGTYDFWKSMDFEGIKNNPDVKKLLKKFKVEANVEDTNFGTKGYIAVKLGKRQMSLVLTECEVYTPKMSYAKNGEELGMSIGFSLQKLTSSQRIMLETFELFYRGLILFHIESFKKDDKKYKHKDFKKIVDSMKEFDRENTTFIKDGKENNSYFYSKFVSEVDAKKRNKELKAKCKDPKKQFNASGTEVKIYNKIKRKAELCKNLPDEYAGKILECYLIKITLGKIHTHKDVTRFKTFTNAMLVFNARSANSGLTQEELSEFEKRGALRQPTDENESKDEESSSKTECGSDSEGEDQERSGFVINTE